MTLKGPGVKGERKLPVCPYIKKVIRLRTRYLRVSILSAWTWCLQTEAAI